MGSAPYAHAAAVTDHPCRQGMWGIFEVISDTMIVCTISVLVVLCAVDYNDPANKGIAIERAFHAAFGPLGTAIVGVSLFLFVLSTIIVIVFYTEKQGEYLFGTSFGKIMRFVGCVMVILGGFISFDHAGVFLDFTLGLVVFTNMCGMILLHKEVRVLTRDFFRNEKFYPGVRERKKKS